VFLYGELAGPVAGRTRAALRRGGIAGLTARMTGTTGLDRLRPDFGPSRPHASAGVTLVAAREPLVAFNLTLQPPASLDDARRIAALVREGGEQGLPGLRAIGVQLDGGVAQVSMNVERPLDLSLAEVVQVVARHAPLASAELVGLAPRAALAGFPDALPMPGFDAARHVIEDALGLDTAISDRSK
jgi:glutamate formiminotransferase/glutamate formiminotransferase/formiminotetrahydrofolate cyclodeaminase